MNGLSPFSYYYDQRGRLDSLLYPNGVAEVRKYDDDGRMTFLLHRAPSCDARMAHRWFLRHGHDPMGQDVSYDAGGRADSVHTYGGSAIHSGYTAHGGLAWYVHTDSVNVSTRSETYAVDPLGNVRESAVTFPTQVPDGIHYYNQQTARLDSIVKRNTQPDDFIQSSRYDAAGNQIQSSQARFVPDKTGHMLVPIETDAQSAYDANGRMRFYTERGAPHPGVEVFPEEEYSDQETRYDALGRRVWVKTRHIPTITAAQCGDFCSVERFVWDGDQLLAEFRMPDSLAEQDTALVVQPGTGVDGDPRSSAASASVFVALGPGAVHARTRDGSAARRASRGRRCRHARLQLVRDVSAARLARQRDGDRVRRRGVR